MATATAIQLGLVPGFALQDGDLLAELLQGGAGGGAVGNGAQWGLGSTTNPAAVASGNQSQTNALAMVTSVIVVTATATTNSVRLPVIPTCTMVRIYNGTPATGGQTVYVFPPVGQAIDGAPTNGSVNLAAAARCDYLFLGGTAWISDLLGSPSA